MVGIQIPRDLVNYPTIGGIAGMTLGVVEVVYGVVYMPLDLQDKTRIGKFHRKSGSGEFLRGLGLLVRSDILFEKGNNLVIQSHEKRMSEDKRYRTRHREPMRITDE